MNQEYENAVVLGIEKFRYAMAYCRTIFREYAVGTKNVIVLLVSHDEEINRDTLRFLKTYQEKNKVDHFIIVSSAKGAEKTVENYAEVPYSFVGCSPKESEALEWLYNLCNLEQYMIVNSFRLSGDHDVFRIADGKAVTKTDIVARVVMGLESVPSEEELLKEKEMPIQELKRIPWFEVWEEVPHASEAVGQLDYIVKQALFPLVCEGKISPSDQIMLFGLTKTAQSAREQLKGYHIVAYLDNDSRKWGKSVAGLPVLNPNEISNRENADLKVLICSRRYQEMIAQLMELGYRRGNHFFVVFSERLGADLSEASECYILENRILEGKRIYEEIRRTYPTECILVRPHTGTGDIFLLGGYISHIMQRLGKEKVILTVPKHSEKKVAELFGMNALVYPMEEAWKLLAFVRMIGFERLNVFSDNCNIDQKRIAGIEGYKNIDMHTLFQKMVFEKNTKTTHFKFEQKNADSIFIKYGLKKGKTVLLAPYSGSYKSFPMEQWEKLAVLLIQNGYSVCTNIGSKEEAAVKGTAAVGIPYNKITDFVSKAGFFIGTRSGLCDIVTASSALMIVLYPFHLVEDGHYYRFFSLEKMELRTEKLLEMEYDSDITQEQIGEIMNFIEKN